MFLSWLIACSRPTACTTTATSVRCEHETAQIGTRDVHWQVPDGEPPSDGWPAALLFQGSGFPASTFWSVSRAAPFGGVHQVELTTALLDAGFAVVTPEAMGEGLTCWNTNVPPWASSWDTSPDAELMDGLFAGLADGTFGPVNPDDLVAAGISSGGYMTSRVAVTWPERFGAVAVVAGSYATCAGPVCSVPDAPTTEHPPTLFVHGALDPVVPIGTMRKYEDWLDVSGVPTEEHVAPLGVHAWPGDAPEEILGFFQGR